MVKKIISVTIILLTCYSIFIVLAPKRWQASQHQWQGNIIRAQKFIYDNTDSFANVIVGSSLSCRLINDSLSHTYNLSFAGLSIYDGLTILTHKTQIPKNVFIEMNFVLRKEDVDFISSLYSPVPYHAKKILLSLRDDKQPLGILGVQINSKFTKKIVKNLKQLLHLHSENVTSESENKLFEKRLQHNLEGYSHPPAQELLNERFLSLKKYINELEARGANVVFFEMPINSQLHRLPYTTTLRETFHKNFPQSKYEYIQIRVSDKYKTTDGFHLGDNEALQYTNYLKSEMQNYSH